MSKNQKVFQKSRKNGQQILLFFQKSQKMVKKSFYIFKKVKKWSKNCHKRSENKLRQRKMGVGMRGRVGGEANIRY